MTGKRGFKKEELIASRVPRDLVADLTKLEEAEHLDRSTAVRRLLYAGIREWKLEHAAKLYQENRATLAKASEDAGVSVRQMMDYMKQKKIPMQYDMEDFEHDLKVIYKRTGKKPARKAEGADGEDVPTGGAPNS